MEVTNIIDDDDEEEIPNFTPTTAPATPQVLLMSPSVRIFDIHSTPSYSPIVSSYDNDGKEKDGENKILIEKEIKHADLQHEEKIVDRDKLKQIPPTQSTDFSVEAMKKR